MNLVYFTIGYQEQYIELLKLCLRTLKEQCDMSNIQTMVMCDAPFYDKVQQLGVDYIMLTRANTGAMQVSMRKLEVFSFDRINEFDKVVYLDSDIIITGDLAPIFREIQMKDKLYVFDESDDYEEHNKIYFGCQNYTNDDILKFRYMGIKVFNCGQFGFRVSDEMRAHFYNILYFINGYKEEYYYEQSFMNYYFNTLNARISMFNKYTSLANRNDRVNKDTVIVHYADANMPYQVKLHKMNQDYDTIIRNCS